MEGHFYERAHDSHKLLAEMDMKKEEKRKKRKEGEKRNFGESAGRKRNLT